MKAQGQIRQGAWMTIRDATRRTGLSGPTLRYYERIGLIDPVARDTDSGHRRYSRSELETLEALSCLRAAGMSVEDMREYLRLMEIGDAAAARQRELFARQADRLSADIDQLRVRLTYLQRKADMWDARDRGDGEAERQAVEDILRAVDQFDHTQKETT